MSNFFISFQEDDVENNMQSFEYSHEMEDGATMCGKQKEPESDFTELRALLLFLLLRQAMFKVADRAIVLLLRFSSCSYMALVR